MEVPDNIVNKLIKLLKMADCAGASEQEVETAFRMASELATRYAVDLATFDKDRLNFEDPFVTEKLETAAGIYRRPPCDRMVVSILIAHFDVNIVYQHERPAEILIIGRRSKVVFAMYLYHFLKNQFNRIWVGYKREYDAPISSRASVFEGAHIGLSNKLYQQKTEVERDQLEKNARENDIDLDDLRENYGLSVLSEKQQREKAVEEMVGKTIPVKVRRREIEDWDGYNEGKQKGSEIEIHDPIGHKETGKING